MRKEAIICIVIVILIFILDFFTQNYTEKRMNELIEELENLRSEITKEEVNYENALEKVSKIDKISKEIHHKLAYFIEHDELEKAETGLTVLKSFVELKDYEMAISEIDKTIFIIEHIEDKYKFNIENIF